jgi:hypothetical protein
MDSRAYDPEPTSTGSTTPTTAPSLAPTPTPTLESFSLDDLLEAITIIGSASQDVSKLDITFEKVVQIDAQDGPALDLAIKELLDLAGGVEM